MPQVSPDGAAERLEEGGTRMVRASKVSECKRGEYPEVPPTGSARSQAIALPLRYTPVLGLHHLP